ncbi:hypothetical protein B5E41_15975 [Rhizobium esperanzae]|uniref:Uncharacterized protein n=1 Tax=Rhizobium esperanzae TaxID=1967781 RepID=A0A246DTQ7_9HYPH|nr:hypothetical protein B5E41_15975 [Rhizobium esperanzae]
MNENLRTHLFTRHAEFSSRLRPSKPARSHFRKRPLIGGFRLWRLHCRAGRRPFGLDAKTYCDKTAPIYWCA